MTKPILPIALILGLLSCAIPVTSQDANSPPVPGAGQVTNRVQPVQQNVATPQSTVAPQNAPAPSATSEFVIGSGDLIEVTVYGAPDFAKQVRVADTGDVSLPLLGTIHVAGLTIRDAELLLQKKLSDGGYFNDPQVSIFEREYATQGISVLGEVQRPGIYPLPGPRVLFDAISAAGGVTPRAGNTITITHRARPHDIETVKLPANETLPPESNVAVFPGDTVVVSKAGIVYVVGDVRMPGGFVMENSRLTVLQAVALAQGANPTAKLDKTILIRKKDQGHQEIPIPLDRVMSAKVSDPQLQAEDVVFIPRSNVKAGFRRGLEAVLQTATGVAIYRR